MDPESLIEILWKNSKQQQDRPPSIMADKRVKQPTGVMTREQYNAQYRNRLQQIRAKNPSLMSKSEAQLRQKTKQLEQLIRAKKAKGQDVSDDQEQLSNNYSNLKKYDANPLYRATPQDEQRYQGMHRIYFSPKDAHDRLTKTNLDLGDLFTKAKNFTQNAEALTVKDKNGNDIPYSDALDQVARQIGLSRGDAQRFLRQRLGGNVPKRVLTAAVRTDQTGEFDDEEQFTNAPAATRKVQKEQQISAYTNGPAFKQIVKHLKPQIKGFTTAAEGNLRVRKQQLEAFIKQNEGKQDVTNERDQLGKVYSELKKINADPTYLATPGEMQRNRNIVRIMLDPKGTAQALMDQGIDLSDMFGETKQLEGQGSAARGNAKVRTLDGDIVDYDVALEKVGNALGLSKVDTLRFLKGHFGKDLRKLFTTVATHISKQLPNGLDRKSLVEKEEGGLNEGQTPWSTAIQDDAILRNPDLGTISDAEAYWRHIQDGWNNPLSILANGIEGSRNKGHFRSDKERSDLENLARFLGDMGTQMLATAGPKTLGPKALQFFRLAGLAEKGNAAFKGLKGVQFMTNLLTKGETALNKMGLAGNILRQGGKFIAGNAISTATEASKEANRTGKSYGQAALDVAKGQLQGLTTLQYAFGHDENGRALDFTERIKGLVNQGGQALGLAHSLAKTPQALKLAKGWVPDVEHLKDSPIVGAILVAQGITKTLPKEQRAKFEAFAKEKLNEAAHNLLNPPKLSDAAKQHAEGIEKDLLKGLTEAGRSDKHAQAEAKHIATLWSVGLDTAAKKEKITFEEAIHKYGRPTIHVVDESEIPTEGAFYQRRTAKDALSEAQKLGWKLTPDGNKLLDPLGRSADSAITMVPSGQVKKGQTVVATNGDHVYVLNKTVRSLTREANRLERRGYVDSVLLPGTPFGAPEQALAIRIKLSPDQPLSGLQGAPKKALSFNQITEKLKQLADPKTGFWFTDAGRAFDDIAGKENFDELMYAWGALSPGTRVPQNLQGALQALILKRKHPGDSAEELTQKFLSEPFLAHKSGEKSNYGIESEAAVHRMFQGLLDPEKYGDNQQGQKTNNFRADTKAPIEGGPRVTTTIDRHVMHFLGFDDRKKSLTPAQYRWANGVVNAIAKRMGVQPHMVQSLMWAGEKMRKGQGAGEFQEALNYNPGLLEQAKLALKGNADPRWSGIQVNEVPIGGWHPTLLSPSSARVLESIGDEGSTVGQAGRFSRSQESIAPYYQDFGIPASLHSGSLSQGGKVHPASILNLPHGDSRHASFVHGVESLLGSGPGRGITTASEYSHRGTAAIRIAAKTLPKEIQKLVREGGLDFTQTSEGFVFHNLPEPAAKALAQEAQRLGLKAQTRRYELAQGGEESFQKGLAGLPMIRKNADRAVHAIDKLTLAREEDLKAMGGDREAVEQIREGNRKMRGFLGYQQEEGGIKGAFTVKPPTEKEAAQVAVYLTKGKADASTSLHEVVGHYLFEVLGDEGRAHMAKAMGFSSVDTAATEQFVRHFERYVRDGRAPNAQLKQAFRSFRDWLTQIYTHLRGTPLEKKIPREVRRKFEQMLGANLEGGKNYRAPIGKTWGPPIPYKLLPMRDEEEDDDKDGFASPTRRNK